MKKALVTGGAGFIGSHVADALLAKGVEVLVVDDLSTGNKKNVPKGATFLKKSILHPAFGKAVLKFKPDVVFHLAAAASVPESVAQPAENAEANVIGTVRVAEAARAAGAKCFVFSSTGGALYATGEPPFAEDAVAEPKSPYGIAKKAAEEYLRFFSREYGMACVILRYANVYGPRQASKGEGAVLPSFADAITEGRTVAVHGTGEQTRDFICVDDVVAANMAAADRGMSGVFNIGTGRELSVNTLLSALETALGKKGEVVHGSARAGDLMRSCLRVEKAKKELGWEPTISLEEGLKRYVSAR
jgi:UDP-glucose 4-epimerase